LIGVFKKGCGDDILDKYAEIRKKKFEDVIHPVSYGNIKLLYETDPKTASEKEPFKSMNTDPNFSENMIKNAFSMCHDFTQYYPQAKAAGTTILG